ncbi:MAG TPA: methylated-DNA--[protein]-cysteine S-methyltransferase [Candidatus Binataceae bacterium]|nr:methylated-DNA--[protein]-cysteine S-methyltransferase [Candidatus Binataceae bacterium]
MNFETEIENLVVDEDSGFDAMLDTARKRTARALDRIRRPLARVGFVDTGLGTLFVAEGPRGIITIHYPHGDSAKGVIRELKQHFDLETDEEAARKIGASIDRVLKGDLSALDQRIDLTLAGDGFQRRALEKLRKVPPGAVTTYQALAAISGEPNGQRAVGNAMASNPIPVFVPCHRVIRSDGAIGNYGGGVDRKIALLRAEGFALGKELKVGDTAVYGHQGTHIFCRPTCSAARRANRARMLIFADAEHARHAGLRACKLCRPASAA